VVPPVVNLSFQENEVNLNQSALHNLDNTAHLDISVDQSFEQSKQGDISVDQHDTSLIGVSHEDRSFSHIPKGKKKVKKIAKKKKVATNPITSPLEDEIIHP
jgi:hypothetical protein